MILSYGAFPALKVGGLGTNPDLFPQVLASTQPAAIQIPSGAQFEGQQFIVRASGNLFVHGTSPTVNVSLYAVAGGIPASAPLTATSYTAVVALTAQQSLTTAATYPWALEVRLQGDSVSGVLQVCSAVISINGVSNAVTKANLTGVVFNSGVTPSGTIPYSNATGPAVTFVPAITFGVTDALNSANLLQNILES